MCVCGLVPGLVLLLCCWAGVELGLWELIKDRGREAELVSEHGLNSLEGLNRRAQASHSLCGFFCVVCLVLGAEGLSLSLSVCVEVV